MRKLVVKATGSTKMKVGHFFSSSNSLVFCVRSRLDKIVADGNMLGQKGLMLTTDLCKEEKWLIPMLMLQD